MSVYEKYNEKKELVDKIIAGLIYIEASSEIFEMMSKLENIILPKCNDCKWASSESNGKIKCEVHNMSFDGNIQICKHFIYRA